MFMKFKWRGERCEGLRMYTHAYKKREARAVEFTYAKKKTLGRSQTARVQLGGLSHFSCPLGLAALHATRSPFISCLSCLLPPPAPAWLIIWALKILIFASSRTAIRMLPRAKWNSAYPRAFLSLVFCRWQLSHITRSGGVSERLAFWEYLRPNYFTCRLLRMSGEERNFNAAPLQFEMLRQQGNIFAKYFESQDLLSRGRIRFKNIV